MSRSIIIGAGVAAICAAVYFSYQAQPPGAESVSGTINTAGKVRTRDGESAGPSSGAGAIPDPADKVSLAGLKSAAAVLGTRAREMSARPGEEGATGAEIGRAASELGTTAQAALDGRIMMEKSAAAALERRTAELHGAVGQLGRDPGAAADARKKAAALAHAAIAARSPEVNAPRSTE